MPEIKEVFLPHQKNDHNGGTPTSYMSQLKELPNIYTRKKNQSGSIVL